MDLKGSRLSHTVNPNIKTKISSSERFFAIQLVEHDRYYYPIIPYDLLAPGVTIVIADFYNQLIKYVIYVRNVLTC